MTAPALAGGLAGLRFDECLGAGLRFDERLAHGEDTDFFYRATLYGARIVYSAEPVVQETIPPHRATLAYQSMRAFCLANKIAALLTGLTRNQVEAMSPVERQQLADQCRRITALAEPRRDDATVKAGVLADLQTRRRDE